ncbi:MAG: hypothetical protein PUP90_01035 [Nostoc sp. S4]|nr:hypothetical protein [Nostoc sp. S4]
MFRAYIKVAIALFPRLKLELGGIGAVRRRHRSLALTHNHIYFFGSPE